MSAMKRFKELLYSGDPLFSERWSEGHYQIMQNNITGKFVISSDKGMTATEELALGSVSDTLDEAITKLQTYHQNQ